jgi:hypothetical protein
MCHADIWAVAEPSAWREPLRVDLPNGRSWIYGSFKASPACDRTGTPLALTSGQELEQTQGASQMERTFLLPNGVQKQAWAVPVGIVVLLMILGITIASIASDIFPTY